MARKPRIYYPGALYHVILRGNDGQGIFFDDQDRTRFYFLTQEGIERFGHRIHAFCLMSTHAHLAIQVEEVSLSRILQNLSFRYTRWIIGVTIDQVIFFRAIQGCARGCGSLFIRTDTLPPFKPGESRMVTEPEEYRWSGHRAYLGLETIPGLRQNGYWDNFREVCQRLEGPTGGSYWRGRRRAGKRNTTRGRMRIAGF